MTTLCSIILFSRAPYYLFKDWEQTIKIRKSQCFHLTDKKTKAHKSDLSKVTQANDKKTDILIWYTILFHCTISIKNIKNKEVLQAKCQKLSSSNLGLYISELGMGGRGMLYSSQVKNTDIQKIHTKNLPTGRFYLLQRNTVRC